MSDFKTYTSSYEVLARRVGEGGESIVTSQGQVIANEGDYVIVDGDYTYVATEQDFKKCWKLAPSAKK